MLALVLPSMVLSNPMETSGLRHSEIGIQIYLLVKCGTHLSVHVVYTSEACVNNTVTRVTGPALKDVVRRQVSDVTGTGIKLNDAVWFERPFDLHAHVRTGSSKS